MHRLLPGRLVVAIGVSGAVASAQVDEPAVAQAMANGALRLRSLQQADGDG